MIKRLVAGIITVCLLVTTFSGCCCFVEPYGTPVSDSEPELNIFDYPEQQILTDSKNIVLNASNTYLLIHPVASYNLTAQIKSKHRYYFDWSAEIAPYDLALIWGKLTLPDVDKHIKYSQSNRWYHFNYDAYCPVSELFIYEHSSNNHIIPASYNLRYLLDKVQTGDILRLEGYLVEISGTVNNGNVTWKTSTSRSDAGDGACEVFYVNKIIYNNRIYY